MFVLRYCVCVSVSLLAVLSWNTGLTAQTVSSIEGKSEAEKLSLDPDKSQPRVTDIKQMQESSIPSQNANNISTPTGKGNNSPSNMLSQSTTSPTSEAPEQNSEPILEQLPPNNLNPNGNPLLRPTQPEDVETNTNKHLTLNEVIAIALQNNRAIQESRIAVEEEKALLVEERAALYPILEIDSRLNREFLERQVGDFADGSGDTVSKAREATGIFNVFLRYDIYAGGERDGRIVRRRREIRDRQLELERIAEQVRFEATDNYYLLQNADAQRAISEADVVNASQTLRDATLLEQAGLGTRFDVLMAEGDLAAANEQLTRAIAEQRTARRRLAETLSLGQQVELKAGDQIDPINLKINIGEDVIEISQNGIRICDDDDKTCEKENSITNQENSITNRENRLCKQDTRISESDSLPFLRQFIVQAYKNRAELEQQLVQREIGEQDRRIAMAGIIPRWDFQANYGFDDDFDNGLGALVNYSFETRLTWRLFDGGRAFAGARAAERRIDQANIKFANLRNEIRFEVEESFYSWIANKENICSTEQNVVTREESLRLARLRFQAGVGTQTDVINAQRDLSQARGNFLQAVIQYNQSLNALQRSVSNLPNNRLFEMR